MANMTLLCRTITTFSKTKAFDEDAMRSFLQRLVDAKLGVYLGSGGSGEAHALSRDELRRVYEIGVAVCKGKVPVNANPPEQHTAQANIEHAQIAIKAGIEVVNIYGPAAWHGYRPTDLEFADYYDEIFAAIKHPVALAPNPTIGYTPRPALLANIANRYSQVVAVNLRGVGDTYLIDLKDLMKRDIEYYVPIGGSLNAFNLGATGLLAPEANIVPKSFRQYIDCYESGNYKELAVVYAHLLRITEYVAKWNQSNPRWQKMAMKVLKIPGGEGGLRGPYRMPPDDEVARFTDGLLRLRMPEIDEMARAAGLKLPA